MKAITVWRRCTERGEWEHNHIEDGHVPYSQGGPTPMCEHQRKQWANQQWIRKHCWLDGERIVDGPIEHVRDEAQAAR